MVKIKIGDTIEFLDKDWDGLYICHGRVVGFIKRIIFYGIKPQLKIVGLRVVGNLYSSLSYDYIYKIPLKSNLIICKK